MLRKLYLSPIGIFISLAMNVLAVFRKPFMVYGFFNSVQGKFYKKTRIGSTVVLVNKKTIDISDGVWVGHYSLLDGIGGITIGEGVNIASHTCIYTHSSQNAVRLLGKKFIEIPAKERAGYVIEKVEIGAYTFIGTSCVILPGTKIGQACIVGAGSIVKGEFPDFSVIVGNPARVVGNVHDTDAKLLAQGCDFSNYFDKKFKPLNNA